VRLSDFDLVVDVDCNSPECSPQFVFVINFNFVEFLLSINRPFDTKTIKVTAEMSSIGSFSIDIHPYNAYSGLIASELKTTPIKDQLISVITKWSAVVQKLYEEAAKMEKFPELCYYCP
jgi:hypothetical protein